MLATRPSPRRIDVDRLRRLHALSTPQTTVMSADVVASRRVRSPAAAGSASRCACRCRAGRGRTRRGRAAGAPLPAGRRADPAALPRDDGAEAVVRLEHQLRAVDADRQLERQVAWSSATAGSPDRFRATATCRSRCASATRPPRPTPATTPPTAPTACSRSAIRRRSSTSPYRALHETTVEVEAS